MKEYVEVMPAYGRDYKNKAEIVAAWDNGDDFIETTSRRYCSKRDFPADQFNVIGRYGELRKVTNLQGK